MIKSMTGFGKAQLEEGNRTITVEIRSLNSKQLDLNLRIPGSLREKEYELRNILSRSIDRGKADISVYVEYNVPPKQMVINHALATNYYDELKKLGTAFGENIPLLPIVVKMPEVMRSEKAEFDEAEYAVIVKAIDKALVNFNRFRVDEGLSLYNDLNSRINIIQELLQHVAKSDKERQPTLRERIRKNMTEFVEAAKIDANRFEQELIYYFEKIDITEEKTRLKTHLDYFTKTMDEEENQGRKIGFISQEIGREINTIGSKANDATIQKLVVQMKDELEKIKEQSLNIL